MCTNDAHVLFPVRIKEQNVRMPSARASLYRDHNVTY